MGIVDSEVKMMYATVLIAIITAITMAATGVLALVQGATLGIPAIECALAALSCCCAAGLLSTGRSAIDKLQKRIEELEEQLAAEGST